MYTGPGTVKQVFYPSYIFFFGGGGARSFDLQLYSIQKSILVCNDTIFMSELRMNNLLLTNLACGHINITVIKTCMVTVKIIIINSY